MRKQQILLIVAIVTSLVLIVLFIQLPKQPASVLNKPVADADSLKLQQAIGLVNGENPMEGIMMLRELVTKDSTNVDAQFYLGAFAIRSGQIDKAVARFDKVLALRPNEVRYIVEVGYAYFQIDSLQRSLACFNKALSIDPNDQNSLFFTAKAHEGLGNLEEAKRNYQKLLPLVTDTVVINNVQQYITNIDKKLNP